MTFNVFFFHRDIGVILYANMSFSRGASPHSSMRMKKGVSRESVATPTGSVMSGVGASSVASPVPPTPPHRSRRNSSNMWIVLSVAASTVVSSVSFQWMFEWLCILILIVLVSPISYQLHRPHPSTLPVTQHNVLITFIQSPHHHHNHYPGP